MTAAAAGRDGDIDAELAARGELLKNAVGGAKAAEFGRVASDRLAAELGRRQDLRDASHDVSSGADWDRVAANHVDHAELAERRAQPGPLAHDATAAAVDRASTAVASIARSRDPDEDLRDARHERDRRDAQARSDADSHELVR